MGASHAFANIDLARAQFAQAWQALERGEDWQTLAQGLEQYPLWNELAIEAARRDPTLPPTSEALAFLQRVRDHHSSERLRAHWLGAAVEAERWQDGLTLAPKNPGISARCQIEQSRLALGQGNEARALALYLHPRSRPDACDGLFQAMAERGWITAWIKRKRLDLALGAGQIGLARALAKDLGPRNQARIERWHRARTDPASYLATPGEFTAVAAEALAKRDPEALDTWLAQLSLPAKVRQRVLETQALHAILDRHPKTSGYLTALARPFELPGLAEWSVRHALLLNDPQGTLLAIDELPSTLAKQPRWQFWRGWALDALGRDPNDALAQAARSNSFYGFLAADRLGRGYALPSKVVKNVAVSDPTPGQLIARELWMQGLVGRARAQWRAELRGQDRDALSQATELARQWGWDSEVIRGAVNTGQRALAYTHPASLKPLVGEHAGTNGVDTPWVLALTRSESLFQSDVRSGAGALGLMQIMPATGRGLAKQLATGWRGNAMLLEPDINIRFGVSYLTGLMQRFGGNQLLATAAYNAGPNQVERWRPAAGQTDPVLWAETIPFKETRGYVQKVMHAAVLYQRQLAGDQGRLSDRMRPIEARTAP